MIEEEYWCILNDEAGRNVRSSGEDNGSSKLKTSQVLEIRELDRVCSQTQIAKMFNISVATVGRIIRRDSWRDI